MISKETNIDPDMVLAKCMDKLKGHIGQTREHICTHNFYIIWLTTEFVDVMKITFMIGKYG